MEEKTRKCCVLVTRPEAQAAELERELTALGACVVCQPTLEIRPPRDGGRALDQALQHPELYDWCVFSSVNGVRAVAGRLALCEHPERVIRSWKCASIGPGTSRALAEAGWSVDFMPDVFRAEDLAAGLVPAARDHARFLLIRASRGREALADTLRDAGGCVAQVTAYESRDVDTDSPLWNPENLRDMERGRFDWVTVSSSAIANATVRLFGSALARTRVASISPLTSAALGKLGVRVDFEAPEATMHALARCVLAECPPRGDRDGEGRP